MIWFSPTVKLKPILTGEATYISFAENGIIWLVNLHPFVVWLEPVITGDHGRQMDTTSINKDIKFYVSRKVLQKNKPEPFIQDPIYRFLLNLLLLQSQFSQGVFC